MIEPHMFFIHIVSVQLALIFPFFCLFFLTRLYTLYLSLASSERVFFFDFFFGSYAVMCPADIRTRRSCVA